MLRPLSITSLVLVFLLAAAGGCAYPRRTTHQNPAPAGRVSSFDMPSDMWMLRIMSAELPPTNGAGHPWDDDGTGPDPFVRIKVDGVVMWQSEVIENTNQPNWDVSLPDNLLIPENKSFRIEIWDEDGGMSGDPLGYIERKGLPDTAMPNSDAALMLSNKATLHMHIGQPRPRHGVGLEVEIRPDALHVIRVEPYSPAARADIEVGDRITEIGPVAVTHMDDDDAMSRLSLAGDRDEALVVVSGKNAKRTVTLDDKPLWMSMPKPDTWY